MIKKPKKKKMPKFADVSTEYRLALYKEKAINYQYYNQCYDEWEAYHNEVIRNMSSGCGGGWQYDQIRDCFVNQMGDTRG